MLKQAVEELAKERQAEVVTKVKDYYGNETKVDIGIKDSVFHRGIGFSIQGEEVKIVGDRFQISENHVTTLQNQLNQQYTHKATMSALRTLGFQPVSQKVQETIHIKAYAL